MTTQVDGLPKTKTETFIGRQAWKFLLGVCLMIGFFGITDMAGVPQTFTKAKPY